MPKKYRTLIISCIFISLFLIGGTTFYHTIFSTKYGNEKVLAAINAKIPGQLEIQNMHIRLMGPQRFEGIVLRDEYGKQILKMESFTTDSTVQDLLANHFFDKHAEAKSLQSTIRYHSEGKTNIQAALGMESYSWIPGKPFPSFEIKDTNASVQSEETTDTLSVHLSGLTEEKATRGNFTLEGSFRQIEDLSFSGQVTNMPSLFSQFLVSTAMVSKPREGLINIVFGDTLIFNAEKKEGAISYSLQGRQGNSPTQGRSVEIKGVIKGDLSLDQHLELSKVSGELRGMIHDVSTEAVSAGLGYDPAFTAKLEAFFGPKLNLDLQFAFDSLRGPLDAYLYGKTGEVRLQGTVTERGLVLREPLLAEVDATPQLARAFFQLYVPILKGTVSTEKRISLLVDPEDFLLPLSFSRLDSLRISRGSLDLGKMRVANDGQLKKVLAMLNSPNADTVSIWFTPVYFSVRNSVLTMDRFDLLLMDSFPLAGWGYVDFHRDQINMSIGVSGKAIQNAFVVDVPENAMVQIPLKGKIGHAKLDKSKAAAKLSSLVSASSGTPQGIIVGTVLGLASGGLKEDRVPSPTTEPLPWNVESLTDVKKHL